MTDPHPFPKADYGQNVNSPDVVIIGAGISGASKSKSKCALRVYEANRGEKRNVYCHRHDPPVWSSQLCNH